MGDALFDKQAKQQEGRVQMLTMASRDNQVIYNKRQVPVVPAT